MHLTHAQRAAEEVRDLLSPACLTIAVAGSIRRGKAEPKDIEIVCVPIAERARPVFGEVASGMIPLEARVAELVRTRQIEHDPHLKRDGPKYKRLRVLVNAQWLPVDLFIVHPDSFGYQLAIRTGDGAFSRLLVTPRDAGGLMMLGLRAEGGFVWQGEARIPCRTEDEFFAALGISAIPSPDQRNEETVWRLRQNAVFPSCGAKNAVQ